MSTPSPQRPAPSATEAPGAAASPPHAGEQPKRARRAPLDPRLVREVRAARGHVLRVTALGLLQAGAVIATALLIARLGAGLLVDHRSPTASPLLLVGLVAALAVRAGAVLLEQRTAHRAATDAIADLRGRLLDHAARLGPRGTAGRGVDIAALATTGIEKLRPYLVGYVPQLLLSATVTPLCLLAIGLLDPISALISAITLPLIPVFMILVGMLTQGRSEALLVQMRMLWGQMVDLIDGLPTLRALGRERGPERTVRELGERHRAATMGSLRYAFLSSMVLELLATLCVALVAVSIGMRLVYAQMPLEPALAVLVLAPEVYFPLRRVGVQYHASTDGLAAVSAAFEVLDEPIQTDGTITAPDLRTAVLRLDDVSVRSRDGLAPYRASFELRPGEVLAVTGASGSGKTTVVHVLLGLLPPDIGRAEIIGADGSMVDVQDLERATLWRQIALLPQRPVLPPGTIRGLLHAADPAADDAQLEAAARACALDAVIAERGWDADLGRGGSGISLGERQRLSLARALLSPAPLVVLDEPTAHLDGATEQVVLDLLDTLRAQGRTVLMVAHRDRLVERADRIVEIRAERQEVPE